MNVWIVHLSFYFIYIFFAHKKGQKSGWQKFIITLGLRKKAEENCLCCHKKAFVWPSAFMSFFFSGECYGKGRLGHKILPQKCQSVHIVVFIYGSLFTWVLKIEVINHRNHYFMDKCNYELGEGEDPSVNTANAQRRVENLILTT